MGDSIGARHQTRSMGSHEIGARHKKRVWMVTPDAPLGEWVDFDAVLPGELELSQQGEPEWAQSSFELAHGLEVSEADQATVPSEFIEALFKKPSK